ncbi:MAG: hypothetical protein AAFU41_00705 [Pseudomonadota bacterium]
MSCYLTPLDVCIEIFGGRSEFECIVGSKPKSSYAWSRAAKYREAGDLPAYIQRRVMRHARKIKLGEFQALWLIEGSSRKIIEPAVMAVRDQAKRQRLAAE